MKSNPGWEMRRDILHRDAQMKLLEPLVSHGWTASIENGPDGDEYVLVHAKRGSSEHVVALLYTSAVANAVYITLARKAEHIYINGELYRLEDYAYGVDTPISSSTEFPALLDRWNAESVEGKFVGDEDQVADSPPSDVRRILSETPIEAIWLRLRQLQSVTLAKKVIIDRYRIAMSQSDDDVVQQKAEGVAYALRNAADYFRGPTALRNVSQRVLNLYYGSLAFAFAEMLSKPDGPQTLADIEASTKQGHGLYTIDGAEPGLGHLVVGVIKSGFFPAWMKTAGLDVTQIPSKKPKSYDDLSGFPAGSWITIEQLFATIPEVSDLFLDIFDTAPRYVTPVYDGRLNSRLYGAAPSHTSYINLVDSSARLSKDDIARFPGPISQIHGGLLQGSHRSFKVTVAHTSDYWQQALHYSSLSSNAILLPVFDVVDEFRMICLVLLYGLSIVVRYRPSIWRRVQEGDLDHIRVLVEAFLDCVERVLPEEFLATITGKRISALQPGSIFA